ncbi:hypothetical protein AUK04_03895 [Candidatus Roizmanbacteria bacterium CG2_30_33_16]|nr:ribosome recycling factor [Candidatus Roizmanbacteria bacterium]OIP83024.1 MAG: hypothetical protein AUK04_03895 [Candidatus Roizmanbacteria bacterium CG2_30_33_16]
MNVYQTEFKASCNKVINQLKEELKSIRTGRANPAMVENLIVEAYGGQSKLKLLEMATIMNEAPLILAITPFDPSTVTEIEKAILKSPLDLSPRPQGNKLLITIPPLSEEQREKMVKIINQAIETHRHSVRNYRDETRKKIKYDFEAKTITEDDKFRMEKDIDTLTQKIMEEIQVIKEKKDAEIREV